MRFILASLLFSLTAFTAEPEFPLTEDSKPQPNAPKGTLIKDSFIAKEGSLFPGTQREYQIYLPAGFDKTKPAAFMVFQDGVIYQTPVVFDNLIAKKDIPPLVGIFIKPGVVPAANDKALPRFNRSYEYDSITPTYSQFLLDEFLPAIEKKHGIQLSTDPNHAAISGNSSGGICAFMVAWHRPDRFRRVFTGVGTYVGIHGGDQLPVLVRKFEPKPLRVFLQSGTGDNNLYCGDWWMANQMMERSLIWAGYDVNHAWGEGGHNAKHASQIFPDVLRWLWRDWQTNIEIKANANAKAESKWKGYEVVGEGEWQSKAEIDYQFSMSSQNSGDVFIAGASGVTVLSPDGKTRYLQPVFENSRAQAIAAFSGDSLLASRREGEDKWLLSKLEAGKWHDIAASTETSRFSVTHSGLMILNNWRELTVVSPNGIVLNTQACKEGAAATTLSPDQSILYVADQYDRYIHSYHLLPDGKLVNSEPYCRLEIKDGARDAECTGLCVDTNGWLYVATSLGIQVCDQAGRVNFIIPTPKQPLDVCFGGKDLSELFIACGDAIYKRPTKAHGIVSGQMAPIKPPLPKL